MAGFVRGLTRRGAGGLARPNASDTIIDYLERSRDAVQAAIDDAAFCRTIAKIAEVTASALRAGGKLVLAGNSGSAADAEHIAGEVVDRLNYDCAPLAAIALTTDSSVLTALANDWGYEGVFERQIRGSGDVLIVISTSGRSPNILRAIAAARQQRLAVVGLTGRSGGEMVPLCDLCLQAPAEAAQLIQQIHITAAHIICGLIEEHLFPRVGGSG
jgi:D-sedoheptulose 7-phosphate isomerase